MNKSILQTTSAAGPETAPAAALERRAWLSRLSLSEFRCYAHVDIETDGRPVVLTGPNGAGKTNLLEAISFLVPGRGLRRARLSEVDRHGPGKNSRLASPGVSDVASKGAWAVAATVMAPGGPRELGTGREPVADGASPEAGRERRLVKIDGALARSQQKLGEIVSMTWLTPQMDGLFRDSASGRRRFLDRLVYGFDIAHAGRVAAYEQSLRERARLLKTGAAEAAWLDALEDSMARHGIAIAAARRDLVNRLAQACTVRVGAFPVADLVLTGEVDRWLDDMAALRAEESLREALAGSRRRDAEAGGAVTGPHRSDLAVRHVDRNMAAADCSTGEQKALLISVVLAHARLIALHRGAAPLLLLDEVAAHLDETRRDALYDEILALGAQAWLTGTDAAPFAALGDAAQFLSVRDAAITAAPPPLLERAPGNMS
ncbi:MAG: DNA replication/repair protein RecF [Alphaproteobacteria bacterium]